tara:strand:- start:17705 stop:18778 length:1074 start_codon:yes stop_codon:yes gene_type:complete
LAQEVKESKIMLKNSFQKKTNLAFYQIMAIAIGFFSLIILLGAMLLTKAILFGQLLSGKLESACGCISHLSFSSHPFIFSSLIVSSFILAAFFGSVIYKIIKFKNSTSQFVKKNLKTRSKITSSRLEILSTVLGLNNRIVEIISEQPVIFCYGFLKPKICVSTGLTKRLSKKELIAVLKHEQHHLRVYEPIKLFIIKVISRVLFFVPGLKFLTDQYLTLSELAADHRATNGFTDKAPLAQALYKVISSSERLSIKNNLALSFFGLAMEERINKLSDEDYKPKFKFFNTKLGVSFLSVLVMPFLFNILFASAFSLGNLDQNSVSCSLNQSNISQQCEMLLQSFDCPFSHNSSNITCIN